MTGRPVTDPALLALLNSDGPAPAAAPQGSAAPARKPVTDPALLEQLNAQEEPYSGPLAAIGDLGLTAMSNATVGAVGTPLAGVVARLSMEDPQKAKREWQDKYVYKPQTREVKETLGAVGDALAPVGAAINRGVESVYSGIGKIAGPEYEKSARQTVDALGNFFDIGLDMTGAAPVGAAVQRGAQLSREAAQQSAALARVAKTPIEAAEAAGLRISPTSLADATNPGRAPGKVARLGDAFAGADSNIINQKHNRMQVNNISMQDIGLPPNTPVSDAAMAKARAPHAATYEQVKRAVPTTPVDREFETAVLSVGRGTSSVLPIPASVENLRGVLLRPMNGAEMIDTISDLRVKGWKAFLAKDNPNLNAEGSAMLDMAAALEKHLDRAVERNAPQLAGRYQEARRGFAKIDLIENARLGDDIDPEALVRANKRSNALDGGLKVIAETAVRFPRDFAVRSPRMNETGSISFSSLASPFRKAAGHMVSATRGEARAPKLGMEGPLSYYYREQRPAPREPITDSSRLLGPAEIRLPQERTMGQPSTERPPLALPAPGRSSAPNPNAAFRGDELGYSPDVAAAGMRHPGGTPLGGHSPPMSLSDSLERYIANQKGEGIGFENVLIEPTKRKAFPTVAGKRQRGIKQGEKVGNRENVRGAAGAEDRGMALELALQGKRVPKDKRTALSRAIEKEARKGKD